MPVETFRLILDGPELSEDDVERLYEWGCGDASVDVANDVQVLNFDRDSASLVAGIVTAIRNVESALSRNRVARVTQEEFVTMALIAERTGRSREGIRLLIEGSRGPGDFPAPRQLDATRRVWLWSDVDRWFRERLGESLVDASRREQFLSALNAVLFARQQLSEIARHASESSESSVENDIGLVRALLRVQ
jgi:predicted DNA-binding transcriptional regulator AlpA